MKLGETEVAVVGAGPAGAAAAVAAARAGDRVTVVDEYPSPGGQIYRQQAAAAPGASQPSQPPVFQALRQSSAEVLTNTLVWGTEDEQTLLLYREGAGTQQLRAQSIVLATGAYDRPVAFPGWTLPGVWTAGGIQAMLKGQAVLPGRRVLLAGAGPFLMPVAQALSEAGATVVAVAEATTRRAWARELPRFLGHWARLREAVAYQRALASARIPYYFGHLLVRVEGQAAVERATIVAVDRDWRPKPATQRTFAVDLVGLGYGFLASTELVRLLGCELRHDPVQAQLLPWCSPEQETSQPGIFVAGETTGIGGAELALVEGQIAGLSAARRLGRGFGAERWRELASALARRSPPSDAEPSPPAP